MSANLNWLHGNWAGQTGVAYFGDPNGNQWQTSSTRQPTAGRSWLVMCSTDFGRVYVDDFVSIATGSTGITGNIGDIETNDGLISGETSDFAIMEIMTWNRALTTSEIFGVMGYLNYACQQPSQYSPPSVALVGSQSLAYGKAAYASSSFGSGSSVTDAVQYKNESAIQNCGWSNIYHSANGDMSPWMQVDLGSVSTIASVSIYPRSDCCQNRMAGTAVYVGNTALGQQTGQLSQASLLAALGNPSACYTVPASNAGNVISAACSGTGRYITLQRNQNDFMNLCALMVYGLASNPAQAR